MRGVLRRHGIDPAPLRRHGGTWECFLAAPTAQIAAVRSSRPGRGLDERAVEPLVRTFAMVVRDGLRDRVAQSIDRDGNGAVHALLLERPEEALDVRGRLVTAARADLLDASTGDEAPESLTGDRVAIHDEGHEVIAKATS